MLALLGLGFGLASPNATAAEGAPTHAISMHGDPAYPADFTHFPSLNPNAPKGGRLTLGALGGFDTLQALNIRGVAADGLRSYLYDSLMARGPDEAFTLYGLVAAAVTVAADRSAITFELRPEARFSDGRPLTTADVGFTWALLRDKGPPFLRSHYKKVTAADIAGPHRITFKFADGADREIALIMGLMPILPKHATDAATFDQTTLDPPIGSGPYRIESFEAGRFISYRRNPDYWARDLPVRRGSYNFDEVRYEYYRDQSALFEAFKAGSIDARVETDPGRWVEGYTFAAAGTRLIRREIPLSVPAGMTALVLNTRRGPLADPAVRRAMIELFDFEWINQSLYHGRYARTDSYFARSDLASTGTPASAAERALLAPFASEIRPDILAGQWRLPRSDGSDSDRNRLKAAFERLKAAGYRLDGRRLVATKTGQPLALELLARTKEQERLMLAYCRTLERVGIACTIRQVDDSQYWRRLKTFDFDIIQWAWPNSLSPGNEQIHRFSSRFADVEGSLNLAGVRSPAVDAMIEAMLRAATREQFLAAVRAFDRALLSGDYVVPLFHLPGLWIAHWNRIRGPDTVPLLGESFDRWWSVTSAQ